MSHKESLGRAIKGLAAEHGLPNRFAVSELAQAAGLSNLQAGTYLAGSLTAVSDYAGLKLSRVKLNGISYVNAESR